MKNRLIKLSLVIVIPVLALLVTYGIAGGSGAVVHASISAPTIHNIYPTTAPNDLDTPIVISGANFTAWLSGTLVITPPTVYLGAAPLANVYWVNTSSLSTTVPWGFNPGVYTLTVQNPDGAMGILSNAFTLTQGIGMWTTGGPYGGNIGNVVLHPMTPTHLYASAEGSGLFFSADAGSHWQPLLMDQIVKRLAIDPHQPKVMYIGVGNGVVRTEDGGFSWDNVVPAQVPTNKYAYEMDAFVHPTISGTVYLAVWGYYDEGTGVYKSTNKGETWIPITAGLTDTQVSSIAFHPDNPNVLVLATQSGGVFFSSNEGSQWTIGAQVITTTSGFRKNIYFDPFGRHEVWLVDEDCCSRVYKSSDPSLTSWEQITITTDGQIHEVHSLTFHPTISATVWAGSGEGYVSSDGGQTWQSAGAGLIMGSVYAHGVKNFAVDASSFPGNPILYTGTGRGMYKSVDGGVSWFETNQGLSGVVVWKLAVSPHNADELYISTASRGALWSGNGGHSWFEVDMPQPGWTADLMVDPVIPSRVYFTGEDGSSGTILPVVRISDDRGANWHTVQLPLPLELNSWVGRAYALTAPANQPGRLLAGIGVHPPGWTGGWVGPRGGLYLSQDYGEHWEMIQPTVPISQVAVITYDPVDPRIVYAGTRGGTMLKSQDCGASWQSIYTWSGIPDIVTIAVHPRHHVIVVAGLMESARGIPGGEDGLYISTDSGLSWTLLGPGDGWVNVLAYDAHVPPFLYAGTSGLLRSSDNGLRWEVAAGMYEGNIQSLATTIDGERVMVYVGVTGGAVAQPGMLNLSMRESTTFLGSGVFRLTTILLTPRIYLPFVVR